MKHTAAPLAAESRMFRSKWSPPQTAESLIRRDRLESMLSIGWKRRLMTIVAPAGYGKTTLLQTWANKQKRTVGWLRLDSQDENLGRFLSYLAHAIPTFPAAYQKSCSDWIMAQEEAYLGHALESLAADWTARIQDSGQHVMIILDGCEYVRHPDIRRFLDLFIRFGPPELHVILSGRRLPGMEALKSQAGGSSRYTRRIWP